MAAGSDAGGTVIPLPPLLTVGGVVPLVGRRDSWRALEDAWAASAGARRVVLLSGETGAGKTRLLTEFALSVHERGATVLFGTCSADQTVPYQAFAEAFGPVLAAQGAGDTGDAFGGDTAELARLVPGRAAELGLHDSGRGDPEAERGRLYRAVSVAVATIARSTPLLIVLDDLHWARRPTVDLLVELVRDQTQTNVMILGSFRSAPSDIGEALRSVLADLHRLPGVTRLPLGSLDLTGIEAFVAAAADQPVDAELRAVVEMLSRETDGNAFLLVELWLQLVETGRVRQVGGRWIVDRQLTGFGSPEGVRAAVGARLDRLDDATRGLLEVAAVIGAAFEPGIVAAAVGTSVDTALVSMDGAVRARIVDDDRAGTYRFAHELIRRSIYDGLDGSRRRRHHLAVARALGDVDETVGEQARHLAAAVPLVERAEAVAAAIRAADVAAMAFAYDDAARFLETALALAPHGSVDLQLRAANATMRAGDAAGAKVRCLDAHALALRTGDAPGQIAAALAYGEAAWRDVRDCTTAAGLLRGALALADDDPTRVRLQAALTRALALAGDGDTAMVLGEDALEAARSLGDPTAVHTALDALSYAPWTPATIDRQLALTHEAVAVAQQRNDVEWESLANSKLLYGQITVGDLDAARRSAERHRQLVTDVGQRLFAALDAQAQALLALGDGRLAEAERLAGSADEITRTLTNSPPGGYGVQMFAIRREQGRLDEARPVVEAVARLDRSNSAWRPALAVMYAELGLLDEAASELRLLTSDRLAAVPRDALWAGSLSYLADTCRIVGDRDAAGAVYDELIAWRGLVVHVGFLLAAHGAVDRYLGELAATLGWEREAEIHFEAALRIDEASRMPVWLAHTQLSYGRFLATRGRDADRSRASELLTAAGISAERIGLLTVAREVSRSLAAPPPHRAPQPDPSTLTEREWAVVRLVAEGCSNREIGARLHISQHTAANHVRSILMKTDSANRTEAAAWALRRDLPGGR